MAYQEHARDARQIAARCAVITLSDTRTPETDKSGKKIRELIEVVETHLDQTLPGFGELFRMLSFQQIGSGAMLSRAVGGVARGKLLFAMPGSTAAVELAMTQLILPELKHLVHELRK